MFYLSKINKYSIDDLEVVTQLQIHSYFIETRAQITSKVMLKEHLRKNHVFVWKKCTNKQKQHLQKEQHKAFLT